MIKEIIKPKYCYRYDEWHPWFAWYPVVFESNGKWYYVWLINIERIQKSFDDFHGGGFTSEYRFIKYG